MKKKWILFLLLCCLSAVMSSHVWADSVIETNIAVPVSQMVWSDDGNALILISADEISLVSVSGGASAERIAIDEDDALISISGSGVAAAVSSDRDRIFIYEPGSYSKEMKEIDPGFSVLSVSISEDGTQIVADSADQIRTVIYSVKDGKELHDLDGFQTAAPVYDSTLSSDGQYLLWHSRGTFAVQNVATGKLGETISLWDFASSFALSPDNKVLAVAIINEDYENGTVIFFDPQSGSELGRSDLGAKAPYEVSYSADGSVLFAADTDSVYRINPETFEVTRQYVITDPAKENERINRIAASPNGSSAAVLTTEGDLLLVTK